MHAQVRAVEYGVQTLGIRRTPETPGKARHALAQGLCKVASGRTSDRSLDHETRQMTRETRKAPFGFRGFRVVSWLSCSKDPPPSWLSTWHMPCALARPALTCASSHVIVIFEEPDASGWGRSGPESPLGCDVNESHSGGRGEAPRTGRRVAGPSCSTAVLPVDIPAPIPSLIQPIRHPCERAPMIASRGQFDDREGFMAGLALGPPARAVFGNRRGYCTLCARAPGQIAPAPCRFLWGLSFRCVRLKLARRTRDHGRRCPQSISVGTAYRTRHRIRAESRIGRKK